MLEPLDPARRVWVVEFTVRDASLVGGARYDTAELSVEDLDFSSELAKDMEAFVATPEALPVEEDNAVPGGALRITRRSGFSQCASAAQAASDGLSAAPGSPRSPCREGSSPSRRRLHRGQRRGPRRAPRGRRSTASHRTRPQPCAAARRRPRGRPPTARPARDATAAEGAASSRARATGEASRTTRVAAFSRASCVCSLHTKRHKHLTSVTTRGSHP